MSDTVSEKGSVESHQTSIPDLYNSLILPSARKQINFLITGNDVVWSASDPEVETSFNNRVDDAIHAGEFVDMNGNKQQTPRISGKGRSDHEALYLCEQYLKRQLEKLKQLSENYSESKK